LGAFASLLFSASFDIAFFTFATFAWSGSCFFASFLAGFDFIAEALVDSFFTLGYFF